MKNKERERKREREREVRIIERFSWMENNLWGHLCIIITLRVEKYTECCSVSAENRLFCNSSGFDVIVPGNRFDAEFHHRTSKKSWTYNFHICNYVITYIILSIKLSETYLYSFTSMKISIDVALQHSHYCAGSYIIFCASTINGSLNIWLGKPELPIICKFKIADRAEFSNDLQNFLTCCCEYFFFSLMDFPLEVHHQHFYLFNTNVLFKKNPI